MENLDFTAQRNRYHWNHHTLTNIAYAIAPIDPQRAAGLAAQARDVAKSKKVDLAPSTIAEASLRLIEKM